LRGLELVVAAPVFVVLELLEVLADLLHEQEHLEPCIGAVRMDLASSATGDGTGDERIEVKNGAEDAEDVEAQEGTSVT
jgi:hypothetical protein